MNKENQNKDDILEITKRLDAIIRLQMANLSTNKKYSMVNLYSILQDSGLSTGDIGRIVNKAANKVSSEIIHHKSDIKKKLSKNNEK